MTDADVDRLLNSLFAQLLRPGLAPGARISALDATIGRGLADADAGRTQPSNAIFDRLQAKYGPLATEQPSP